MSFYSSLRFYSPTMPPQLTTDDLCEFVSSFMSVGVAEPCKGMTLELAFDTYGNGPVQSIADDFEKYGSNAEFTNWELSERFDSYADLANRLGSIKKPLHRAYVNLGNATASITDEFLRVGSAENDTEFSPDGWSLQIGPIESYGLDSEEHHLVGWISLDFSGSGYIFPWVFSDLRNRLESESRIRNVMHLCKATWPVQHSTPTFRQRTIRTRMGGLWPYGSVDKQLDWAWGILESG